MTISWPPYGRWAAGYGTDAGGAVLGAEDARSPARSATPCRRAATRSSPPASRSASPPSSKKKDAGLPVHPVAEQRRRSASSACSCPTRCATRSATATSPARSTRAAGREAPQYLAALQAGAVNGLLDLSLIQTDKYEEALRQGISRLWAGEDPQTILDEVAAQWDAVTERIGVDKQRAAYEAWASKPNAYPTAS